MPSTCTSSKYFRTVERGTNLGCLQHYVLNVFKISVSGRAYSSSLKSDRQEQPTNVPRCIISQSNSTLSKVGGHLIFLKVMNL